MWPVCVVGLVCWEGVGFFVLFTRPRLLLLVGIERKDSDVLPDSPDSLVAVDGRICTERRRREEREVSSSERERHSAMTEGGGRGKNRDGEVF